MLAIEHYLIKNLKLEKESLKLKELMNYLLANNFEVEFITTSNSTNEVFAYNEESAIKMSNANGLYIRQVIENPNKTLTIDIYLEESSVTVEAEGLINNEDFIYYLKNNKGSVLVNNERKRFTLNSLRELSPYLIKDGLLLKYTMQELNEIVEKFFTYKVLPVEFYI